MLGFERKLVANLTAARDPQTRAGVASFVDGSLGDMPEHLRLGVALQSILLSAFAPLVRARTGSGGDISATVRWLENSAVPLLRQYVRLFRSLVLFAEQELSPVPPSGP